MQKQMVMTVIGRDRPGLVEAVAAAVSGNGGNWLESRMCQLGGEFAGILRVEVPVEREADLLAAFKALEFQGLTAVVRSDSPAAPVPGGSHAVLEIVGHDRPGIVREISSELARQGVNVRELRSECLSAPMSGETLFQARLDVVAPASCELSALIQRLESIATDLMVEIKVQTGEG